MLFFEHSSRIFLETPIPFRMYSHSIITLLFDFLIFFYFPLQQQKNLLSDNSFIPWGTMYMQASVSLHCRLEPVIPCFFVFFCNLTFSILIQWKNTHQCLSRIWLKIKEKVYMDFLKSLFIIIHGCFSKKVE